MCCIIEKIAFWKNLVFRSGIMLHLGELNPSNPLTKFCSPSELLWQFEEIPQIKPLTTIVNMLNHVGGHKIENMPLLPWQQPLGWHSDDDFVTMVIATGLP